MPTALIGTIGGGKLEFDAIADARALLAGQRGGRPNAASRWARRWASAAAAWSGCATNCCSPPTPSACAPNCWHALQGHMPVALFGGGHVGLAIVSVLGALPVRTHWIDSREEVFPAELPLNVRCEHSEPVHGAVPTLEAGSHVLIMSFSHAEDLDILAACLKRRRERADLPFIGLIGSKSKWATFRHRLEARGFSPGRAGRRHQPDRRARRGRQGTRGHRRGGGRPADAAAALTRAKG